MPATISAPSKGNIVRNIRYGYEALVMATTPKHGGRMLVHRLDGDYADTWMPQDWFEVITSGNEKCWKCNGSGLFYMGGSVVNGVYTGKTGPCFGCEGKGESNDADRIRCHIYFRDHYRVAI